MTRSRRSFLGGAAAGLVTSACTRGDGHDDDAPGRTMLRVSVVGTYLLPVYREISAAFERRFPHVRIELFASALDWEQQIQQTILDASSGRRADVSMQAFHRIGALVERQLVEPIDDLIARGGVDPLLGRYSRLASIGGHVYGLPVRISTPLIFVNGRFADDRSPEQAGWPALLAIARRAAAAGRIGGFVDYTAAGNWVFLALVQSFGGRLAQLLEPAGSRDLPITKALEVMRAVGEVGATDLTQDQTRQVFTSGELGFLVGASSSYQSMKDRIGAAFPMRVVRMPIGSAQATVPAGGSLLAILARDPKRREIAWEFVRYVGGAECQSLLARRMGTTPISGSAFADPQLQSYLASNQGLRVSMADMARLTGWYAFPGADSVKMSRLIADQCRRVALLKATPKEALSIMRVDAQSLSLA